MQLLARHSLELLRICLAPWCFLGVAAIYFSRSFGWRSLSDNDAAYAFGVAKYMAAHLSLKEPVVWQWLLPDAPLPHAAFDYWPGGTSLLLVPVFFLFGATTWLASTVVAALALVSVLLFFRVLEKLFPGATAPNLIVAGLFAFCPLLATYRFESEGVIPFQVTMLGAILSLLSGRHASAVGLACAGLFFRADGLLFFGAVVAAGYLLSKWEHKSTGPVLAAAGGSLALYLGFNLILHGALTPPAARLSLQLTRYNDLYVFGPKRMLSLAEVARKLLSPAYWKERMYFTRWAMTLVFPVKGVPLDLFFAASALLFAARRRWALAVLVFFAAGYSFLLAYLQPVVFATHRTLFILLPIYYLVAAGAVYEFCALLPAIPNAWRQWAVSAILLLGAGASGTLSVYGPRGLATSPLEQSLEAVAPLLAERVVASDRPWSIIESTQALAVVVPENGEDAIAEVLRRYQVRYLVTTGYYDWMQEGSRSLLRRLEGEGEIAIQGFTAKVIRREGNVIVAEIER